jgi:hypothetical protein
MSLDLAHWSGETSGEKSFHGAWMNHYCAAA